MITLFLLAAQAMGGTPGFMAKSDDMGKAPCVIHMVKPQGCDSDARCVAVVNRNHTLAVAPAIAGYCGPGTAPFADEGGTLQTILEPNLSTSGRPIVVPVLAPQGSGYPSSGWMYLPVPTVTVSAVAYTGAWTHLFALQVRPGFVVDVFDDDASLDIGDHMRLGTCRSQQITIGVNDTVEFSADCAPAELAKSRR